MARYTDAVCRLCRREGVKLYLKGDKCYSDKCFPHGLKVRITAGRREKPDGSLNADSRERLVSGALSSVTFLVCLSAR